MFDSGMHQKIQPGVVSRKRYQKLNDIKPCCCRFTSDASQPEVGIFLGNVISDNNYTIMYNIGIDYVLYG